MSTSSLLAVARVIRNMVLVYQLSSVVRTEVTSTKANSMRASTTGKESIPGLMLTFTKAIFKELYNMVSGSHKPLASSMQARIIRTKDTATD